MAFVENKKHQKNDNGQKFETVDSSQCFLSKLSCNFFPYSNKYCKKNYIELHIAIFTYFFDELFQVYVGGVSDAKVSL